MMRRMTCVLCAAVFALGLSAQVADAFQGVLPVTDPAMKCTLNGEWSLKVVDGITDGPTDSANPAMTVPSP